MESLSEFLIRKIQEDNLSMRAVAQRAGLDHDSISRYVNEDSRPTRKSCTKLARVFGVPEEYILMLAGHMLRPEIFTPRTELEWQLLDKFRELSFEEQRYIIAQLDLILDILTRPAYRIIGGEDHEAQETRSDKGAESPPST